MYIWRKLIILLWYLEAGRANKASTLSALTRTLFHIFSFMEMKIKSLSKHATCIAPNCTTSHISQIGQYLHKRLPKHRSVFHQSAWTKIIIVLISTMLDWLKMWLKSGRNRNRFRFLQFKFSSSEWYSNLQYVRQFFHGSHAHSTDDLTAI